MMGIEVLGSHGSGGNSQEALQKGEELRVTFERLLPEVGAILDANPNLQPTDIKALIHSSLDITVFPATLIPYQERHLARGPDESVRGASDESFKLVLATVVPVVDTDRLRFQMNGNGKISEDGRFRLYSFDPLEGHAYAVERSRPESGLYKSGVGFNYEGSAGGVKFTIY